MRGRRLLATACVLGLVAATPGLAEITTTNIRWDEAIDDTHPSFTVADDLYQDPGQDTSGFQIYHAEVPEFDDAFPDYDLLAVYNTHWWPWRLHYMAWDADEEEGYDLTMNYTGLLQDANVAMLTADDAERYAKAYFATANPELVHKHTVVNNTHSEDLGHDVHDPVVTNTLTGWNVTATVWSEWGGQLINYTADFTTDTVADSSATVWATQAGPYHQERGYTPLTPTQRINNDYGNGAWKSRSLVNGHGDLLHPWDEIDQLIYTQAAKATTFDGTEIKVFGEESAAPPSWMADSLAKAGAAVYDEMVTMNHDPGDCGGIEDASNWGFHLNTTDCSLTVYIQRAVSANAGYNPCDGEVYIKSSHHEDRKENYYRDDPPNANLSRNVLGHEFFHVLQCHTVWDRALEENEDPEPPVLRPNWDAIWEAQGRLVETLLTPDDQMDPESPYFQKGDDHSPTGANLLTEKPWRNMCEQGRAYAAYWKYLTMRTLDLDQDGTTAPTDVGQFLHDVLENAEELAYKSPTEDGTNQLEPCEERLPAYVNATLDEYGTADGPANHTQVLTNLSVELLANTSAWTYNNTLSNDNPLDWSTHLEPVTNETIDAVNQPDRESGHWMPGDGDDPEVDAPNKIGAWGMHYFRIADDDPDFDGETINITCLPGEQDALGGEGYDETTLANWTFQIANFAEDSNADLSLIETSPCTQEATTVDLTEPDETYISATRINATAADYEVDIEIEGDS